MASCPSLCSTDENCFSWTQGRFGNLETWFYFPDGPGRCEVTKGSPQDLDWWGIFKLNPCHTFIIVYEYPIGPAASDIHDTSVRQAEELSQADKERQAVLMELQDCPNHIWHPTTSNHIQPHPTTSNHIQPHPTTSNHIQPHPTTSNHIQPHPTTSNHRNGPQKVEKTMERALHEIMKVLRLQVVVIHFR